MGEQADAAAVSLKWGSVEALLTVLSFMFRKLTILFLALTLCWTTVACGGSHEAVSQNRNLSANPPAAAPTRISDGQYPVQQVTYNDANGEYSLFLLNTPPGTPSTFSTKNLQMARLTDDEVKAGQQSYLKVENGQPSLHLTQDFKVAYEHAVTETQTNPQTGQQETVVVRRENSFWAPFAGAAAGSLVGNIAGNLLFRPHYYVPPVYQPGVSVLSGYGGYGTTYAQAVDHYQTRYNAPPPAVRNQTNFRTTGRIRTPSYSQSPVPSSSRYNTSNRPTGSGYGSNTLGQSDRSNYGTFRSPSSNSFGSGRSSGATRSRSSSGFGSRRR